MANNTVFRLANEDIVSDFWPILRTSLYRCGGISAFALLKLTPNWFNQFPTRKSYFQQKMHCFQVYL